MAEIGRIALSILAPILVIVIAVGLFADLMQVGVNFAFEAIKPSGKKLNVANNAKNLFSKKNLFEFTKNIIKVTFLSVLVFLVVRGSLNDLMRVPPNGIGGVTKAMGALVTQIMSYTAVAYIIVGRFRLRVPAPQSHQATDDDKG